MSLYAIAAVRLNDAGRVVSAVIQGVDGAIPAWIGVATEVDAADVANMIANGDSVYTVFIVPGGTVLGPKLKRVALENGAEGIEMYVEVNGRSFKDLVQMESRHVSLALRP
jgi:hypothetical protein